MSTKSKLTRRPVGFRGTCAFSITLGGEITETIDAEGPMGCSVTYSSGSDFGVTIDYGGAADFYLGVRNVTEGAVGDFSASLEIYRREDLS